MSLLTINFEQVVEPFLVLNIYLTFFLSVVDYIFYKRVFYYFIFHLLLLRVTVYHYYVTDESEALVMSCSVTKAFLEISQNSQENACARVFFLIKLDNFISHVYC